MYQINMLCTLNFYYVILYLKKNEREREREREEGRKGGRKKRREGEVGEAKSLKSNPPQKKRLYLSVLMEVNYPPHRWCLATALQSLKGVAVKTQAPQLPFHPFPG